MAKTNGSKTNPGAAKPAAIAPETVTAEAPLEEAIAVEPAAEEAPEAPETPEAPEAIVEAPAAAPESTAAAPDSQDIDECLNALKALLSTVEKLQKVRQEVGDIKPLLVRMLDGEVLTGDELEQLKAGVGGLFRLVRAYSDHQTALTNAQPARTLLDQVLKGSGK